MSPRNEFETEVLRFMARIDEHIANQSPRCNSHAADIKALDTRTTSLEDTRTFITGALALATKLGVAAVAVSGIIYGWISAFGVHAVKGN